MTDRDNIPAWARKIDFVWFLPLVAPFAIYGYVRLFCAVAGVEITPDGNASLAAFSLILGAFSSGCVALHLKMEGMKWTWLARDPSEAKGDEC
jgi:hypothetical protein